MGGGLKRYIGYFDKNPKPFRDFIIEHQDRIVWGADIILDGENIQKDTKWIYKRMLTDFFILEVGKYKEPLHPENNIYHKGLALPKDVLKKIYWYNPKKILNI